MPDGQYYIRIGVKDLDKAKAAINSFGGSVDASLVKVQKSAEKPTRAMAALNQATRGLGNELQYMASRAGPAGDALAVLGKGGLAAAAGLGAIVLGGRQLLRVANEVAELENRLRLVTTSSENLEETQRALADIAQKYGGDLGSLINLYSRAALSSDALGASQEQLRDFTEAVNLSLVITGTNADEARGSLLQLGQALGSDIVRAEEFNSVLEANPRLAKAVAQGIDGMEGSVAKLRAAIVAGEITNREFFAAVLKALPQLRDEYAKTAETATRGWGRIDTATLELVDAFDDATNVSGAWAGVLNSVARGLDAAKEPARQFGEIVKEVRRIIGDIVAELDRFDARIENTIQLRSKLRALVEGRQDRVDLPVPPPLPGSPSIYGPQPEFTVARPPGDLIGLNGATTGNQSQNYANIFGEADIFGDRAIPAAPYRPDNAEARSAIQRLDRASDKLSKSADSLNAPRPTPRPTSEERYTYGGGTFGTAPEFDFSQPPGFALSDPEQNFQITDEMVARLEEGQVAYENLLESNNAFEQAALNTVGILSQSFGDFFADLVLEGKGSVDDLMKELQRLIIRMLVALAIQRALGAAFGGGAGAAVAPTATSFALSGGAAGQGGSTGTAPVFSFHSGRGPGELGPPRYVHPAYFDDAPRFHSGRLASGEIPAVIRNDESVLTPGQMRAMGSPVVNMPVTIKDYAGVNVQAQRNNQNGGMDIIIKQLSSHLAGQIQKPGTEMNSAVRSIGQTTKR